MSKVRTPILRDPPDLVASAAQLLRLAWAPGRIGRPEAALVEQVLSSEGGFEYGAAALVPREAMAIAVLGRRNERLEGVVLTLQAHRRPRTHDPSPTGKDNVLFLFLPNSPA